MGGPLFQVFIISIIALIAVILGIKRLMGPLPGMEPKFCERCKHLNHYEAIQCEKCDHPLKDRRDEQ